MNKFRLASLVLIAFLITGCNLPAASTPTPDLFATLQAATPLTGSTPEPDETSLPPPTFDFNVATLTPISISTGEIPSPSPADGLTGHIVFTCQIFKVQASNQICIMNADGTGFRRLTTNDSKQHFYPSLAPDGKSVLYSAFLETDNYEIYELVLDSGSVNRLTNIYGVETAPEFSPNGSSLTYAKWNASTEHFQIIVAHLALVGDVAGDGGDSGIVRQAFGMDHVEQDQGLDRLLAGSGRELAALQQGLGQLLADEAGAAGDHDTHAASTRLAIFCLAQPRTAALNGLWHHNGRDR
jgi:hypothetical protein